LVSQGISEKSLTSAVVEGFITHYGRDRSSKTVSHYAAYCSQFARYLTTLGISAFIVEQVKPTCDYIPYIFTEDEISKIFHAADNITTIGHCEDRIAVKIQIPMLIRLFYGCGLRLSEALKLRYGNVDFDNGTLFIQNAKGYKDRLVPMDATLAETLSRYCIIAIPNRDKEQLLFEGEKKGKHRHKSTVDIHFKQIVQASGIEIAYLHSNRKVGVHCLRHTFVVHSFHKQDKAGIDNYRTTPSLSIYIGHDSLLETQRYLHNAAGVIEDIWSATSAMAKSIFPEVPQ
jgi:integrase